jgi:sterol desaturase/sphingolipid hydroxylase (fatty acid hydroxylase superfamily)
MPSIKYFTIINSGVWSLGYITYSLFQSYPYVVPIWLYVIDSMLVQIINYTHSLNLYISYTKISYISFLNASILFLASYLTNLTNKQQHNYLNELILFIPYSFIFELIFDFFHYWTHRISHSIPLLYRTFHSYHHLHINVSIMTTFEHKLGDLVFTNMLPVLCTTYILQPSQLYLCVWMIYKIIEEMYGHIGVTTRASSFPQCIWLPRMLGIELYSSQHALHHRRPGVNFSKRFIVWDRMFGTSAE